MEKDGIPGLTSPDEAVHIGDAVEPGQHVYMVNCTFAYCFPINLTIGFFYDDYYCHNCTYNDWSNWSDCPKCSQLGNTIYRNRTRTPKPNIFNLSCSVLSEYDACNITKCECIEGFNCTCNVSDWTDWTPCSKTCGLGSSYRFRQLLNYTGNCILPTLNETKDCFTCCPSKIKFFI